MPGMHIEWPDEIWELIPKPRRTWVRNLVVAAVQRKEKPPVERVSEPDSDPRTFYFRVDGKVVNSMARTAAEAASKLGLDPNPVFLDWATEAEAIARGWVDEEEIKSGEVREDA